MDLPQQASNGGTPALTLDQLLDETKAEASMATCGYILEGVLRMTTILGGDDQLKTGRVYDEAMTYFLASYKAELGDKAAAVAAARLIWNIALFMADPHRDAVHRLIEPILSEPT